MSKKGDRGAKKIWWRVIWLGRPEMLAIATPMTPRSLLLRCICCNVKFTRFPGADEFAVFDTGYR